MAMELYLPTGYYQASLFFTGSAAPTGAAVTFAGKDDGSDTSASGLAAIIVTLYGTHIDPIMNNTITLESCRVKKGPMEDGPFSTIAASNVGNLTGSTLPPNVAILIRKNTAIGGRKGSGRMYVPGIAEADVDETGKVTAAKVTTWQTAWTAFWQGLSDALQPMALAHMAGTYVNSKGQTVVVPQRTPDLVTSLSVDAKAATQRRRLRR